MFVLRVCSFTFCRIIIIINSLTRQKSLFFAVFAGTVIEMQILVVFDVNCIVSQLVLRKDYLQTFFTALAQLLQTLRAELYFLRTVDTVLAKRLHTL